MSEVDISEVFKLHSLRYSIDGQALRDRRIAAGIKSLSFASACGWSRTYQNKLEADHYETVSEETKKAVEEVLRLIEK